MYLLADAGARHFSLEKLAVGALETLVFTLLGIFLLVIAFKVKDTLLPGNLTKQLVEEKNVAIGIVTGSFLIGISIIIASAISG
jgi:uncharacterized membrane protein YjfL (UPF0719 family)